MTDDIKRRLLDFADALETASRLARELAEKSETTVAIDGQAVGRAIRDIQDRLRKGDSA